MATRKQKFVKINTVTFGELNDKSMVVDNTTTDTGVLKRHFAAIQTVIDYQGTIMPKDDLVKKLMIANMVGYPTQSGASHKMWAGKCIAGWIKKNIVTEV